MLCSSLYVFHFVQISVYILISNRSKIGLFSAIVTAFFVDSFSKLQPDEGAATNALPSNLTNIVLLVHGVSFRDTGLPLAIPFEPEGNDVRENVFWSISLALSVSYRWFGFLLASDLV
jgi:hypothetical protein